MHRLLALLALSTYLGACNRGSSARAPADTAIASVAAPQASSDTATRITYLAVATDRDGSLLRLAYAHGILEPASVSASVLTPGLRLDGLSMRGDPVQVRIDTIRPPHDVGQAELDVTVDGLVDEPWEALPDTVAGLSDTAGWSLERYLDSAAEADFHRRHADASRRLQESIGIHGFPRAVLMWWGPDAPRYLPQRSVAVSPSLETTLRGRADSLWRLAVRDLPADDQQLRYHIGHQYASQVDAKPGIIYVWKQAITSRDDERGSFFFVVDARADSIVLARFGHPEWSPRSTLIRIRPRLFFTMPGDPRVFMLAEHSGGWESSGWAVVDASDGHVIATTN